MLNTITADAAEKATLEAYKNQDSVPVSVTDLANDYKLRTRYNGAIAKRAEKPDLGQKPKLKNVRIEELLVDEHYQRLLRLDHVLDIALNFSWEKFQPLSVMRRRGKQLFLTDGQHKAVAAMLVGIEEVPCLVYESKDLTDEANQFYGINDRRRSVPLVVKHKNAVILRDREAMELQEVVNKAQFVLVEGRPTRGNEFNNLSSLKTCIRKTGEDNVLKAITLMRDVWPEEPVDGKVMYGIAVFIKLYSQSPQYKEDRLVRTLNQFASQADMIRGLDQRRRETGTMPASLLASDILEKYNQKLQGGARLRRGPVVDILARKTITSAQLDAASGNSSETQQPRLVTKRGEDTETSEGDLFTQQPTDADD